MNSGVCIFQAKADHDTWQFTCVSAHVPTWFEDNTPYIEIIVPCRQGSVYFKWSFTTLAQNFRGYSCVSRSSLPPLLIMTIHMDQNTDNNLERCHNDWFNGCHPRLTTLRPRLSMLFFTTPSEESPYRIFLLWVSRLASLGMKPLSCSDHRVLQVFHKTRIGNGSSYHALHLSNQLGSLQGAVCKGALATEVTPASHPT